LPIKSVVNQKKEPKQAAAAYFMNKHKKIGDVRREEIHFANATTTC
jgi:hypothetical protein